MAPYNRSYNEKRDYYRMMVHAKVTVTLPGGDTIQGITEDLSANGIQFVTDTPLKVGHNIQVLVEPEGKKTEPLKGEVEIKRVDVNSDNKFVVAGYMTNVK